MAQLHLLLVYDTSSGDVRLEGMENAPVDSGMSVFDDSDQWRAPTDRERSTLIDLESALIGHLTTFSFPAPRWDADRVWDLIREVTFDPDGYARESLDQTALADAMAWECGTCREDVGWVKNVGVERDHGQLLIAAECGHCGYVAHYDLAGDEIEPASHQHL